MISFLLPGWTAAILLVLAIGPLGSFMIVRRMSSFGDTLSHASVLGLSIGVVLDVNPLCVNILFVLLLAIIISWLEQNSFLSLDTILGVIAYSSLSLGLILINLISNNYNIDINSYLFGDLLTVSFFDLIPLAIGSFLVLMILKYYWNEIILMTINSELAVIDGINLYKLRLILIIITALTVGMSTKFFGALIITSLLIIPAASAQQFSNSPEQMVFLSTLIGIFSVTGGVLLSVLFDIPTNPSIVICASFIFILSHIRLKKKST